MWQYTQMKCRPDATNCNKSFEIGKEHECGKKEKIKMMECNIMSWNIARGIDGKLDQIIPVLLEEDIGICYLIEK